MNFSQAVVSAFKRAFDFRGRSSRSEFWYFILFYILYLIMVNILIVVFLDHIAVLFLVFGNVVISLALYFIGAALYVRRLHDINKSGWYVMIPITYLVCNSLWVGWRQGFFQDAVGDVLIISAIVFIVLLIWQIVWLCRKGDAGENRFGPNPLTKSSATS